MYSRLPPSPANLFQMAALATCGIVAALVASLANFSASFVYFLTPVDVANHYSCAINSSLSPRSVAVLTTNLLQVGDITKNYTGDVDALTGKLSPEILQKMRECEAFHSHLYAESSPSPSAAASPPPPPSSSSSSSSSSANADSGMHENEHVEHLLSQMVHCYKETDLMYFKTLKFEDEPQQHIDEFHKCLLNSILIFH